MLAPEKRHRVEPFAAAQDVAGRGLTHALGDDPVLDANALSAVRIGPARGVARSENSGRARLQAVVHEDAAIGFQSGLLRDRRRGFHADADDDQIRIETRAVAQHDLASGC